MLRRKLIPATALAVMSFGLVSVAGPGAASAATPARGGTLTILGQSDVFNLDTVQRVLHREQLSWSACSPVSSSATPTPRLSPPKRSSRPT